MRWLLLTLLACSAPDVNEAPDRGPSPSPAELDREARARAGEAAPPAPTGTGAVVDNDFLDAVPAEAAPEPAPDAAAVDTPAATSRRPPLLLSTPPRRWPAAPFSAWTTAPATLKGPGGSTLARVDRLGVRVEVLAVDDAGSPRVRCSGCSGAAQGLEGQLDPPQLRAAKAPGGGGDALDAVVAFRAAWAGGKELPEGATNAALCALVDHGFSSSADGSAARWDHGGGRIDLSWNGERWDMAPVLPPTESAGWSCRADGSPPDSPPQNPPATAPESP